MHKTKRLLEIDCLRGIAALLVVLCHYTLASDLRAVFKYGNTGVELFFMISGFVIFMTIEKTDRYRNFLISRFARLYPAFWICVLITTVAIFSYNFITRQPDTFPTFKEVVINLTMLEDFFKVPKIDGVYWSLMVELLFYGFISILYLTGQLKRIVPVSYLILILCLINRFWLRAVVPEASGTIADYFLFFDFPMFLAGIMFYRWRFSGFSINQLIIIVGCYVTDILLWEPVGGRALETQLQYGIIVAVYFLLFSLYVTGRLSFIVNKPLLFIGKISYPLYLIHAYIGAGLIIPILVHNKYFPVNTYVASMLVALPVVILMSAVINRYVEVPANRYIKSRLTVKKKVN